LTSNNLGIQNRQDLGMLTTVCNFKWRRYFGNLHIQKRRPSYHLRARSRLRVLTRGHIWVKGKDLLNMILLFSSIWKGGTNPHHVHHPKRVQGRVISLLHLGSHHHLGLLLHHRHENGILTSNSCLCLCPTMTRTHITGLRGLSHGTP
jgi:hypothetical protein